MTDPNPDTTDTNPNPDTEPDTPDTPEPEPDTPDTVSRTELDKVIRQRDKLKEQLRALKPKDTPESTEPTEADKLRTALARTASVSALVSAGITSEDDQAAVLEIPGILSGLEVDEDGTVDTSALSERLSTLKRIFTPKTPARTVPKIKTGQGGDDGPSDPDAARYRRIRTGRSG